MGSILFVYRRPASFIHIDLELLRERWQVREMVARGRGLNPFSVARSVWRADLVFGWFADWHTFLPVTLAWLLRKPAVLVIGGYDTADDRAAGYGLQRGGWRRAISRWTMKRASALIVNSHFTEREARENAGVPHDKLTVVYHGVPDEAGELDSTARAASALTVGVVDRPNLIRKGLLAFAQSALLAPEVEFVLAGRIDEDAEKELPRASNLRLAGWVEQDELVDLYRRSAAYVQVSSHEGFGMSVAEAMLAGCIPVVANKGALPEVVGETGIQLDDPQAPAVAQAVRKAAQASPEQRRQARRRVLERFTIEQRRSGICNVVEAALRSASRET